jgi:hypothetical protein
MNLKRKRHIHMPASPRLVRAKKALGWIWSVRMPALLGILAACIVLMLFGYTKVYRMGPMEAQVELKFRPGGSPSKFSLAAGGWESHNHKGWWALNAHPIKFASQEAADAFLYNEKYARHMLNSLMNEIKPIIIFHILRAIGLGCMSAFLMAAVRYCRRQIPRRQIVRNLAIAPLAAGFFLLGAVAVGLYTYDPDATTAAFEVPDRP